MPGWIRYIGWALTAITIAVYVQMVTVTLPHLSQLAGGMPMFDMRPGGYDFETAREILTGLGEEGRSYYAGVQQVFDSFFPPLMALTIAYWFWRGATRWRKAGLPMSTLALGTLIGFGFLAAAFDMTENALVSEMLATGPQGLAPMLVKSASTFTLAKSVTASLAYIALFAVISGPFVARLLDRKKA